MNTETILKLANEAGITEAYDHSPLYVADGIEELRQFVELIAAAEREECAKVCDALCHAIKSQDYDTCDAVAEGAAICAGVIRKRGKQ